MTFTSEQELADGISGRDRERIFIVRTTCLAWLISLLLSWHAYIHSARVFELSPVIELLDAAPAGADWALFAVNIGCLIWLFMRPLQRTPALGALACMAFWMLQDLLRFQPYLYMYFATILLVVFFKPSGLNALRIMIASVYFWAGFHKFNLTFYLHTFPWFVAPLYKFSEPASGLDFLVYSVVFMVPLFESAIGVLLLFFPRLWRVATLMAFIMLVVVVACLGPTGRGWNKVVWVWNIYLFLLEFILFYKSAAAAEKAPFRLDAPALATIALFTVAPAFALIGWWPSYPAFKLYSGNTETAEVIFAPDENVGLLPNNLGKLVDRASNRMGMDYWTADELEMTAYPTSYVFRRGAEGLCRYLTDRQNAKLRVFDASPFYSTDKTYHDYPLCPAESNASPVTRSKAVARTE